MIAIAIAVTMFFMFAIIAIISKVKEWFIPYMISSGILILVGIVCVVYQLVNLWITALA